MIIYIVLGGGFCVISGEDGGRTGDKEGRVLEFCAGIGVVLHERKLMLGWCFSACYDRVWKHGYVVSHANKADLRDLLIQNYRWRNGLIVR